MEVDSFDKGRIHPGYFCTDEAAASDDSADVAQLQDPVNAHLVDGDTCAQLGGCARRLSASDDLIADAVSVSCDCDPVADDIA